MSLGDDAVRRFRDFLAEPPAPVVSQDRWLGHYRLQREIARGGMGIVFEAEDPRLKRRVAVKILKETEAGADEVARLHREAAIAAQLRHPGIVPVHEVGMARDDSGQTVHFIAMDFVDGRTFAEVIRDPAVTRAERLRLLEDVARAVAFAHANGVVHRDVKPANVLVDGTGRALLTDFGLARSESFQTRLTATHTVMGTPQYMAPEQVQGRLREVDARTDIYALGIMLYEALVGRLPFTSATPAELYDEILHKEPARPISIDPSIARDLEVICLKAFDKDRGHRFASALEFAEDLARFRRGEPILARPPSFFYRLGKRLARKKAAVAVTAAAIVAGIAALVVLAVERGGRSQAEREARRSREQALQSLRKRSESALAAALDFRRAGRLAEMRRYGEEAEAACREAILEFPDRAEPHYELGRLLRALMRDEEAMTEQEWALRKNPRFGPSLYERVVLRSRQYRSRMAELVERAWSEEGRREAPSRRELAANDPGAVSLRAGIESDLRLLEAVHAGVGEGQLGCGRGILAWISGETDQARGLLAAALSRGAQIEEGYEAIATLEMEQRRYEESVRWWSLGIEQDQGYLPLLEGRSRAYLEWGQVEKSLEDAAAAVRKDPSRAAAWITQGIARMTWAAQSDSAGLHQAAVEDFSEALRRDASAPEAWIGRGMARLNWGAFLQSKGEDPSPMYRLATEDLGRALERDSVRDGTWAARGLVQLNWGLWKQERQADPTALFEGAIRDFDDALRRTAGRDRTWMSRALAERCLGGWLEDRGLDPSARYLRAIADWSEALRRNPRREESWVLRGRTRMDLALRSATPESLFRDAVADFTEALKLGSRARLHRADALATWALHRDAAGDLWSRAVEDYDAWLQDSPADLAVRERRATACLKWGVGLQGADQDPSDAYRRAIDDYSALLASKPDRADLWADRGFVRLNWGLSVRRRGGDASSHFADAVDAYGRAIELKSEASYWAYRARAFEERGQFREALADYRKAIELKPELEEQLRASIEKCRRLAGD